MLSILRNRLRTALFAAAFVTFAPTSHANEIVVGQIIDSSPAWIEAGRDYAAGAKTYFDLVNSKGGLNGRRIVYVTRDGRGDATAINAAARALITEEKADVLFGNVGDTTMRVLAASKELPNGLILHAPLTGINIDPSESSRVIQLRATYADETRHLIRHFYSLTLKSFCIVFAGNTQATAAAAARQAIASINAQSPAGGAPANRQTCEADVGSDGATLAQAISKIRAVKPQAVLVLGDTAIVGRFARDFSFKRAGISVGALSLVNHTALLEIAGREAAAGLVISQVVPGPHKAGVPIVREFARAFATFRDEPPSHLSLEGYIAAKALIESLRPAVSARGFKREDISAALSKGSRNDNALVALDYPAGMAGAPNASAPMVEVTMVRGDGRLIH